MTMTPRQLRWAKYVLTDEYMESIYAALPDGVTYETMPQTSRNAIDLNLAAFNACKDVYDLHDACQRWALTDLFESTIDEAINHGDASLPAPEWIV